MKSHRLPEIEPAASLWKRCHNLTTGPTMAGVSLLLPLLLQPFYKLADALVFAVRSSPQFLSFYFVSCVRSSFSLCKLHIIAWPSLCCHWRFRLSLFQLVNAKPVVDTDFGRFISPCIGRNWTAIDAVAMNYIALAIGTFVIIVVYFLR